MTAEQFNIDYHRLLGVNRNADETTILKAFRQLLRKYHPDKVSGQEEKMKLLTMAKVTLLDPEKRAKYEDNYEKNYDHGDNQPDLTADLLKLNIGHRLSDDYRVKIKKWKQEYQCTNIIDNMDMFDTLFEELEQSMFDKATVFDLRTDQLINQDKSEQTMYEELKVIFIAQDFGHLAQYILNHQCRSALAKLYEDVKPTHGYDLPDNLKALIQIIKVSSTLNADIYQNRTKGLYEAVFIHPVNECIDSCLKLINNRMTDVHKREAINVIRNHNILEERMENKQYMHRLKCTPTLRSILKFENNIHNQNIETMEKAMLYIDLCMVYGHPIVLANCLVMASKELIAHMSDAPDAAEVYALKRCIVELCATILHFVSTYANPISQLKYSIQVIRLIKTSNEILAESIEGRKFELFSLKSNQNTRPLIDELDQNLFKLATHCVSKSIRVSPLIDTTFDFTSDILYINLINNELLEKYYQWNIDTFSGHPSAHLYQYSLMEGSWKSWFDDSKFEEYRRKCIEVMLGKTKICELDVAKTMKLEVACLIPNSSNGLFGFLDRLFSKPVETSQTRPMMLRCEKGFIVPDKNYLNMGNNSFNSVDGLIIDIEQGTFEIIVSTDKQLSPLCDGQDIDEIVIKGLSHSVFSLDQADFELDYHPFQLMRFAPKKLENSRYLSTLLAADYLLKMIATNTEVSAEAPFEMKESVDGFLKALPADLREFIMMKKGTSDFGKVHRFWIENGNIPCYRKVEDNDKLTYEFYYTPMVVKKHLMKKNSHGELVDDSEDDLTDDSEDELDTEPNPPKKKISAETRFTRRLTQYYDLIGCYFPVLLRLRELAKLSAVCQILKNTFHALEESKAQLTAPWDDVRSMLQNVRSQITYPICTESKVNELYWKTLRANGLQNDDQVSWSETRRVKDKIRSDLESAEDDLLTDLPKQISKSFELSNSHTLRRLVSNWIKHDQYNALVDYLSTAIYEKKIEKLSKFGNYLSKLGMNLSADGDSVLAECDNGCKWVPAAFSQSDGRRAYGGVVLQPKITTQNDRGFKGFQASTKNAGSSHGGSSAPPSGDPPHPNLKNRAQVFEKYGHGKGWPDVPIRVGDRRDYEYFGKPGTGMKTPQGINVKFGPSGFPLIHNPRHSTRKAAVEAAARASRGRGNNKVFVDDAHAKTRIKKGTGTKNDVNKNYKGDHSEHVHSSDVKGDRLKNNIHHLF